MVAAKTQPADDVHETTEEVELERKSSSGVYYVTEEEFLDQPESTERVELIDGEIYVAPSATYVHQLICREVTYQLEVWLRARPEPQPVVCQAPCDIRFGRDRILQPDVFVFIDSRPGTDEMPLRAIPDLCIEVLSQKRTYDRITKRAIYAEAGVRELWTIDPRGFVERWSGPHLDERLSCIETLTTPLLPDFVLNISAVFPQIG